MTDDKPSGDRASEGRVDLTLGPVLNQRVENYMATLPVEASKSATLRRLIEKALDAEGVP